jgi:hypothetical protein
MKFVLQPWHLLAGILAGYANRELQQVVDYLRTENTVLRESFGQRRIRRRPVALLSSTGSVSGVVGSAPRFPEHSVNSKATAIGTTTLLKIWSGVGAVTFISWAYCVP